MGAADHGVDRWLGRLGGIFLALVLLLAAWTKAIDPLAFLEQIEMEGLAGAMPAWVVAGAALALEVGLGLCLLLDLRRRRVLIPAGLLIAFFLVLTGRAWWRAAHGLLDPAAGCGCFGNLLQRTPAEAFWQDALLMVPAWSLAWVGRPGARFGTRWRYGIAVAGVLGVSLLAWSAPELPLDDLATRLDPGTRLDEICAGEPGTPQHTCLDQVAPGLDRGRQLVVITALDTPAFTDAIDRLNAWVLAGKAPVTVLASAEPDVVQRFFWEWGPAFEVASAPPALLRPLYRRLPRSFVASDGVVSETWDGLPPEVTGYDGAPSEGR